MRRHNAVNQQLLRVEQVLREHQQWQSQPPHESAFTSTQPFFLDTLSPHEWLQWVLIPRMSSMCNGGHPLPETFAVAPYIEMALEANYPGRAKLLAVLVDLDALFTSEDA